MKANFQISKAEYAGRWLYNVWSKLLRRNAHVTRRLVTRGFSPTVAKVMPTVAACTVLLVFLYAAFWLALVLAVLIIVVSLARDGQLDEGDKPPELRDGLLGFGLYDKDGFRVDPGDPKDH